MPALPLSATAHHIARFDVVGTRSPGSRFISHVGLHNQDGAVTYGEALDVVDMAPPLRLSGSIEVHVTGTVPLSNDEVRRIGLWIAGIADELKDQTKRNQYTVHPPFDLRKDNNTGIIRNHRFSCAGLVLKAYGEVGIQLLNLDERFLPLVDQAAVVAAYSAVIPNLRRNPRILSRFGLSGDGPWPVVMAGYVVKSLDRDSDTIRREPYQPQTDDGMF